MAGLLARFLCMMPEAGWSGGHLAATGVRTAVRTGLRTGLLSGIREPRAYPRPEQNDQGLWSGSAGLPPNASELASGATLQDLTGRYQCWVIPPTVIALSRKHKA
jgi:hypothetical protein